MKPRAYHTANENKTFIIALALIWNHQATRKSYLLT